MPILSLYNLMYNNNNSSSKNLWYFGQDEGFGFRASSQLIKSM